MEDYAPITWVLLIVASMVYSGVTKARKRAGKAAKHPSGHPEREEAWPSSTFQTPESAPGHAMRSEYQPVTPDFPGEYVTLEEIPAQEYTPEFTEPKTAASKHSRPQAANRFTQMVETDEIAANSLTNDAHESAATALSEEFNLRQAIIYSEILKPKFEEDR
ncbi:hypothetical protein [Alistipes sp.]|uniref:hypothetical protein n=1 Tax=Alistipes sp. TaxID=1872444 RepID=UPI003AF04ECC